MSTLTILGLASFLFVLGFTARAYRMNTGVGQTPRGAIIEAWTNIAWGFGFNYVANIFLLPLVGASLTASSNFWLGWVYTAISIVRSYAIRRWNNRLQYVGTATKTSP